MSVILSILIDGIAYGMILFMISVGLSVVMGLMRVINLAHGGFALIGGAFAHWFTVGLGLPFESGAVLAIVATMIIALPLEVMLYQRIYKMTGSVDLGFRTLPLHRIVVISVGVAVILGLILALDRTRFGIHLRAAVDHRDTAATLGINTNRIFALTFMLGAGLAALGGILGAELLPIDSYYPLRYMVLFLIVVAVGGMGSITGSFAAALGLGILDTAARYLVSDFAAVAFFVLVMAVLMLRPQGTLRRAA